MTKIFYTSIGLVLCALLLVLLTQCVSDEVVDKDSNVDTNTDSNVDTNTDSNVDTNTDSNVDTNTDSNIDTNTDSNVDTNTDSNVDTNTDSNVDTNTDSKVLDVSFGENPSVVITEVMGDYVDWSDSNSVVNSVQKNHLWFEFYVASEGEELFVPRGGKNYLKFYARGYSLDTGEITDEPMEFFLSLNPALYRGNFYTVYIRYSSYSNFPFLPFSRNAKLNMGTVTKNGNKYVPYIGGSGSYLAMFSTNKGDIVKFAGAPSNVQLPIGVETLWEGDGLAVNSGNTSEHAGKTLKVLLEEPTTKSYSRVIDGTTDSFFSSTHSKNDWSSERVSPSLPTGISCFTVGETAIVIDDSDSDSIPDCTEGGYSETAGKPKATYFGYDLAKMGAEVGKRDVFVEVDYMDVDDYLVVPQKEGLDGAVRTFTNKNGSNPENKLYVHFDVGNLYSSTFSTANYNLNSAEEASQRNSKGGGDKLPALNGVQIVERSQESGGVHSFYNLKQKYFDYRRKGFSHYMIMGITQDPTGVQSSAGVAEFEGNDLLISISGNGAEYTQALVDKNSHFTNQAANIQHQIIVHELGHNLGLDHGGDESMNYKINYPSVMNYLTDSGSDSANALDTSRGTYYLENFFVGDIVTAMGEESQLWVWRIEILDNNPDVMYVLVNERVKELNGIGIPPCLKNTVLRGIARLKEDLQNGTTEAFVKGSGFRPSLFILFGKIAHSFGDPAEVTFDFSEGKQPDIAFNAGVLEATSSIDFNCDGDEVDENLQLESLVREKFYTNWTSTISKDHDDWEKIASYLNANSSETSGRNPLVEGNRVSRFRGNGSDTAPRKIIEEKFHIPKPEDFLKVMDGK